MPPVDPKGEKVNKTRQEIGQKESRAKEDGPKYDFNPFPKVF